MNRENQYLELFKYSRGTYYTWKKEKRPILNLLEKYFNSKDFEEFITTNKISKLERLKELEEIERKYNKLLDCFKEVQGD